MFLSKKMLIFAIPLLLCSCAESVIAPRTPVTSVSAETAAAFAPSPPAFVYDAAAQTPEPSEPSAGSLSPDKEGFGILPGSLPALTAADEKKFDPDKVFCYLAGDGCLTYRDYWYSINGSETSGGILYLKLSLNISLADSNAAYRDLKDKRSLSDRVILSVPQFKDCVIKNGVMYADEYAWEDRRAYPSYEAWREDNGGYINSLDRWTLRLSAPVPVAENARITLFDYDDGGYADLTPRQFQEYLSDPDNIDVVDGTGFILDMVYFKYSGGVITAVYQDGGEG